MLGFYAALLAVQLARPVRWRAGLAAGLGLGVLTPWRAGRTPDPSREAAWAGPHAIALPHGFQSPLDAVSRHGRGEWDAIYQGRHTLQVAGRTWSVNNDMKAFPMPGGLLVAPLRPFAPQPTLITFDEAVTLDQTFAPVLGRQRVMFGIPCLLPNRQPGCAPIEMKRDAAR